MDKSMWTSYFHDLSPEEAVRLFAGAGWTHLEFSNEHSAALLARGEPAEVGAEFLRFCAGLGVRLPQGHLKLSATIALPPGPAREAELAELRRWLDLFAALEIRAGVLHPGGQVEGGPLSDAELFDLNVQALRLLTGHAAGGPTTICLENGVNAGRLLRLIEAVGADNLAICLDTGHLSLGRHRSPEQGQSDYDFIVEAGPRLKALHIADNDGTGDQHLLPFDGGTVDWDGVTRGLRDAGYAGLFNFEVPGECRCSIEERLAKLDRAAEIAARMMAEAGGA